MPTAFLVPDDTTICDKSTTHEKKDNDHSIKSTGVDVIALPKYSPELNPVELTLNAMVQRFNSEFS